MVQFLNVKTLYNLLLADGKTIYTIIGIIGIYAAIGNFSDKREMLSDIKEQKATNDSLRTVTTNLAKENDRLKTVVKTLKSALKHCPEIKQ